MEHDFCDSLVEEDNPIHGLGTLLAHMAGSHTDQVHSFFLYHDTVTLKQKVIFVLRQNETKRNMQFYTKLISMLGEI